MVNLEAYHASRAKRDSVGLPGFAGGIAGDAPELRETMTRRQVYDMQSGADAPEKRLCAPRY